MTWSRVYDLVSAWVNNIQTSIGCMVSVSSIHNKWCIWPACLRDFASTAVYRTVSSTAGPAHLNGSFQAMLQCLIWLRGIDFHLAIWKHNFPFPETIPSYNYLKWDNSWLSISDQSCLGFEAEQNAQIIMCHGWHCKGGCQPAPTSHIPKSGVSGRTLYLMALTPHCVKIWSDWLFLRIKRIVMHVLWILDLLRHSP